MKILTSTSGNKKVEIVNNTNGGFYAKQIQIINTGVGFEESLVQMKSFITEKASIKGQSKYI